MDTVRNGTDNAAAANMLREHPDPRTTLYPERNDHMAVSRKPADATERAADDTALESSIHAGGSTAEAGNPAAAPEIRQSISIPGRVCRELDSLRLNRRLKTSRSRWILEAVIEKIERDAPQ